MNVLLISSYELGRQPFGLASAAAWLRDAGATVSCLDLSIQILMEDVVASADMVAFYLPMHTATRIATSVIARVKRINPRAHLCCYGLYAPLNKEMLQKLGIGTIIGGEVEDALVTLYQQLAEHGIDSRSKIDGIPLVLTTRLKFRMPDRTGLPPLHKYAQLNVGDENWRIVGYTEASRGCKHKCRHCPIVPVYDGKFRIVQQDVVLEDIRQQVAKGAQHITFGDPDFFNGPGHAVPLVKTLHEQFPDLTYDVTIKIEHLLKYSKYLSILRDSGCLFVTSAVETVDDDILKIFDKNHTRGDFIQVVSLFQELGLTLNVTFVTFNPWTSLQGYRDLLALLVKLNLIENVAPIQYAIRLLIPNGSRLLELTEVRELVEEFNEEALAYPWVHPDPRVDQLYKDVLAIVKTGQAKGDSRPAIFEKIWRVAYERPVSEKIYPQPTSALFVPNKSIPYLSENWYC